MRGLLLLCVGLAGCYAPCGEASCASPEPVVEGLWTLDPRDVSDEIADAAMEVAGDVVIVEVVDGDGNVWEVEYAVASSVP